MMAQTAVGPPKKNAPLCEKRRAELRSTGTVLSTRAERKSHQCRGPEYSCQADTADDIKRAFVLEEEFRRDGHKLLRNGAELKCLCPFHQEETPSCSISPKKGVFHCFGCGAGGTFIDYHALKRGITVADAIGELTTRLRGIHPPRKPTPVNPCVTDKPAELISLNLSWLELGTGAELQQLAVLRCVSVEALRLAQAAGVLRFGTVREVRSWIVTDETCAVAQARRLDGKPWDHLDGAKAYTLPGGCATWPVGAIAARQRPKIMLAEGGPDLLAAYHLLWCETRDDITPVCMLGGGSISAVAFPLLERQRIRIYPHVDEAGVHAAERWNDQLVALGCVVDCYDFSNLLRQDGESVQDLNDFLLVGYDDWEANREEEVLP
jgi:CHC2 zinc finger